MAPKMALQSFLPLKGKQARRSVVKLSCLILCGIVKDSQAFPEEDMPEWSRYDGRREKTLENGIGLEEACFLGI